MADFSDEKIQQVWNKGTVVEGYDKDKYRKDCCDAWIQRDLYGKEVEYAWQIDHVYPSSKGGTDDLINLRPMHWENNQSKSDDYPDYTSVKTSEGNKNIEKEQSKSVNDKLQSDLKTKYNIK